LKGKKYIHYVPNAGHGLGMQAVIAIANFYQTTVQSAKHPEFTWKITEKNNNAIVIIKTNNTPKAVNLWSATSKDRDFRDAKWSPQAIPKQKNNYTIKIPIPSEGHIAIYGSVTYSSQDGIDCDLCTNMRVFPVFE